MYIYIYNAVCIVQYALKIKVTSESALPLVGELKWVGFVFQKAKKLADLIRAVAGVTSSSVRVNLKQNNHVYPCNYKNVYPCNCKNGYMKHIKA